MEQDVISTAGHEGGEELRTSPTRRLDYDTYLGERRRAVDAQAEQFASYDKAVLAVSSSFLALSISFVRFIAPQPSHTWLMQVAWALLVIAVFSTVTSLFEGGRSHALLVQQLDAHFDGEEMPSGNPSATSSGRLNTLSLLSLLSGVTFIVLFAGLNL